MQKYILRTELYITILVLFFNLLFASSIEAGPLNGTVKGSGQQLKSYVRIEIGGPQSETTFTDNDGEFSIELSHGTYIIKIIERNRSMTFEVDIPEENTSTEKEFILNW